MVENCIKHSTGLPGLDAVLQGVNPGDNLLWQVDNINDYRVFVEPFSRCAKSSGQRLTYFRFAEHEPLVLADDNIDIYKLSPQKGFEAFISKIHDVIEKNGEGGCYIFDTLSELAHDCYSDRMLGNFFLLTCPYLFKMKAVAYFAVLRNYHSFHAADPISKSTQMFLDVYRHKGKLYVYPLKVKDRLSKTIYRLHAWEGDNFIPITRSIDLADILTSVTKSGLESALYQIGVWNRVFVEADEVLKAFHRGEGSKRRVDEMFNLLLGMIISRDARLSTLAKKYLTLQDLMRIRERMIGTGFIGGKTVGMILARTILKKNYPKYYDIIESHDSFYIGSEVFYSYIVLNDCWWVRKKQKKTVTFMDDIEEAKKRILAGKFPDYMIERFKAMLEYYSMSPIIVRSSSLLEDGFGNMFAGKYESVFCANQGSPAERLEFFLDAVRIIYASSMSEKALKYRAHRGILEQDEQMALLVQRVSGSIDNNLFYPHAAGVGYSFNPFVWDESIKSEAGLLRLVFGLGTRAVDRCDDDYTRLVALSAPGKRPETEKNDSYKFTQKKIDVLDLEANQIMSKDFDEIAEHSTDISISLCASEIDNPYYSRNNNQSSNKYYKMLTFDKLLSITSFADDMKEMMEILSQAYQYPVDIEFTVNFTGCEDYKINLVQCRPLEIKGGGTIVEPPTSIDENDLILRINGPVIGRSRFDNIDRIIYVVPSVYGQLTITERYQIARLIGRLNHLHKKENPDTTMLIGPGRWGTSTPSLGVPVSFVEINNVSIICEIVTMRDQLVPDVSLGTHFFSEMVEMDMLYLALFPDRESNTINEQFFEESPNVLSELLPGEAKWSNAIRVVDVAKQGNPNSLKINANTIKQEVFCYLEKSD
jgi:pyruvate, water dikinase